MLEDAGALAGFVASQDASGLVPVSAQEYAPLQRLMEAAMAR
ncbi:hypothetical protein [Pseudomonas sp. PSKL.D1]|nr:hypothetical protein [Pseudomonas sp. PSKL.D1]WDY55569.1 hypothetical protein PVV54_13180 [Pseudomonas sp. PSKL.D1]